MNGERPRPELFGFFGRAAKLEDGLLEAPDGRTLDLGFVQCDTPVPAEVKRFVCEDEDAESASCGRIALVSLRHRKCASTWVWGEPGDNSMSRRDGDRDGVPRRIPDKKAMPLPVRLVCRATDLDRVAGDPGRHCVEYCVRAGRGAGLEDDLCSKLLEGLNRKLCSLECETIVQGTQGRSTGMNLPVITLDDRDRNNDSRDGEKHGNQSASRSDGPSATHGENVRTRMAATIRRIGTAAVQRSYRCAMEFRILGPLEVLDAESELVVRGAKERAVLAYLLLQPGHVVSAGRLIDELWGEDPLESARKSLQVRVSGLRRALGPDRLLIRPSGYAIRVEPDGLDLDRFQRLTGAADEAAPAAASRLLREALSLWRGPPLADFQAELWALPAVARLEEMRLLALEKRIDADLALGRHADLTGELEALVREHPLRERLRAQLMLALYHAGRQAEALDVYQSTRRALVEELGIEPGQALSDLERAILRQDPTLELARPAVQERSILVAVLDERNLESLVACAVPLARHPRRELILVRPTVARADLPRASADLQRLRERLHAEGTAARIATFASPTPGEDTVRAAAEQDVDLLLIDGPPSLLDDPVLAAVLATAPCDVAVLSGGESAAGPVLVPFVGAEHDWSAVELGAWLARALEVPLRLAGPGLGPRDASRLLADASLAVQRALGVSAEPLVINPGVEDLVRASGEAGFVVAGLSDRWKADGLGPVRSALVGLADTPVLLVRRGLRPSGLAPPESYTRFTWTIRPAT